MRRRLLPLVLALASLAALSSSCAYYNTFYLARKYYFRGTAGMPYPVDKADAAAGQNFSKSIDFSKRVMASYPKSKWVDDAYLLWARSLLGRDDPRETVNMLQDFPVRFPQSDLRPEALFYLGVAYRQSHRSGEAEVSLAQFLEQNPKNALAPYAWLERSRALSALDRDSAAAYCAGQVLERFPRSKLGPRALAARAEALLAAGRYAQARSDFHQLGLAARDDEERLTFLLREADCIEAGRDYPAALGLLRDALGREKPPTVALTDKGLPAPYAPTPGGDRYGRILLRVGGAELQAGHQKEALDAFGEVVRLYPKSPLSAEAQYRTGYAYEIAADDFQKARDQYGLVKDEFPNSAFTAQAQGRVANLDRVTQFKAGGGDTLQRKAEAGFVLAELYLFQHEKPERAVEEYEKIAADLKGTPWAAKALTAKAWVLDRKLGRRAAADSIYWTVVREYPATEAQLAARDYLEQAGAAVPESLIREPVKPLVTPADTASLTPPPTATPSLGQVAGAPRPDAPLFGRSPLRGPSLALGARRPAWDPRYAGLMAGAPGLAGDSPFTGGVEDTAGTRPPPPPKPPHRPSPRDSLPGGPPRPRVPTPSDTLPGHPPLPPVPPPPDSTRKPAPPDSIRRPVPPDSTRRPAPPDTIRHSTGGTGSQ